MRADVRRPDVVLGIDAYHVGRDKKIIRDAADEFSRRIELHQRMFAAMKHVNMPLRIDRYPRDFDEMFAGRELKEIGHRFVIESWNHFLRTAGRDRRCSEQRSQDRKRTNEVTKAVCCMPMV